MCSVPSIPHIFLSPDPLSNHERLGGWSYYLIWTDQPLSRAQGQKAGLTLMLQPGSPLTKVPVAGK